MLCCQGKHTYTLVVFLIFYWGCLLVQDNKSASDKQAAKAAACQYQEDFVISEEDSFILVSVGDFC